MGEWGSLLSPTVPDPMSAIGNSAMWCRLVRYKCEAEEPCFFPPDRPFKQTLQLATPSWCSSKAVWLQVVVDVVHVVYVRAVCLPVHIA